MDADEQPDFLFPIAQGMLLLQPILEPNRQSLHTPLSFIILAFKNELVGSNDNARTLKDNDSSTFCRNLIDSIQ